MTLNKTRDDSTDFHEASRLTELHFLISEMAMSFFITTQIERATRFTRQSKVDPLKHLKLWSFDGVILKSFQQE